MGEKQCAGSSKLLFTSCELNETADLFLAVHCRCNVPEAFPSYITIPFDMAIYVFCILILIT